MTDRIFDRQRGRAYFDVWHEQYAERQARARSNRGLAGLAKRAEQRRNRRDRQREEEDRYGKRSARRQRGRLTPRHRRRRGRFTAAAVAWSTTKFAARRVLHPVRTFRWAVLILLVAIIFTPYSVEQFMHDGRRIIPGSYTGSDGITYASNGCPAPEERGGYLRLASDIGDALHDAGTEPPISTERWQELYRGAGRAVGTWLGTLRTAALYGEQPSAAGRGGPVTQVGNPAACCGSGDGGTLPTDWPNSDTPAMTAARAAQAAGWRGEALVEAVAIAGAESGWDPTASHRNTNGSTDYGEWQINTVHGPLLQQGDWRNPLDNARMAWTVSGQGTSWRPWVTWNTGAYRAYLERARQAVGQVLGQLGPVAALDVPVGTPAAFAGPDGLPAVTAACTPTGGPGPTSDVVERAIAYALAQQGKPYVYGAAPMPAPTGPVPSTFDCSSLMQSAWLAAGIDLPGRQTTQTLDKLGTAVGSLAEVRRGDMVFTSNTHVGMALGDGTMIVAPHSNAVVRVQSIYAFHEARRLVDASALPT